MEGTRHPSHVEDADMKDKHGFGKPVSECTIDQLEHQITYHDTQVLHGRVGTPNVHVRLAELKREFARRVG